VIVINLFGGPDSGKTTQATGIFHAMKRDGMNVEIVNEFAKMCVWEKNFEILKDQLYVMAKQNRSVLRLEGQVDICITDSPIMLSSVYRKAYGETLYSDLLDHMAFECFNRNDNLNFMMKRSEKRYDQTGRYQDLDGAVEIDNVMYEMFKNLKIPFFHLEANEQSVDVAYTYIKKRLAKYDIN
jgi:hypothetical protein|tara:strand:+ start:216 stop:764 length:549 start_codon:yes stop_codon:yes gene_type:complete